MKEEQKKVLVKKVDAKERYLKLYGYQENGGNNDAPKCDPNDGTANCAC